MLTLPPALAHLATYRQFMLYKVVHVAGEPKPRKLPLHPETLVATDAHDPRAWTDAATACARAALLGAPYGVAFSFQPGNGLFFVDIDGALQADGTWSPLAIELFRRFPGAAGEVSYSGEGLHIIARGSAPPHACKNVPLGIELYTEYRFVALTGMHAVGDASTDHTAALATLVADYFPPRAGDGLPDGAWTTEPRADWRGPVDDDELLRRAMKSTSVAAAFGATRATFADLMTRNTDVLAACWPDPLKGYDASSADAALAAHLAFWTGANCERMERLMRQSELVREKWERHDYLPRTILGAASRQKDVLTDKAVEPVAGAPSLPPPTSAPVAAHAPTVSTGPLQPTPVTGNVFLSPADQVAFFAGCVYVYEAHRVLVPGGLMLPPERFKVRYGGYTFLMDNANQRTCRDAWEAFTQNQAYRAPRADRTCFRPDLPPGAVITEGSRSLVNLWWPADVRREKGDVSLFLRHLELVLPNERDRRILLSYMAAVVQHQGYKFQWCPLLQGAEGNGKTTFTRCVAEAVGQRYTHWGRADRINAQFNSFLLNRVFIGVEDIYVPEHKREVWETLKPMITGEMQEIEAKGVDQDSRNVVCNFILNSNHRRAVQKTRNDRRLAIFYTAQQSAVDVERAGMDGEYFGRLYAWLKGKGDWAHFGDHYGYACVAEFLATYPIDPEFNPAGNCQRAPRTSTSDEAVAATVGGIESEVLEAIDQNLPGFRGGWVSSMALDQLLTRLRLDARLPRTMRREMLEGMGYVHHPALREGRVNNDVLPDAGKPRLFVKPDHPSVTLTGPAEVARAYTAAQV